MKTVDDNKNTRLIFEPSGIENLDVHMSESWQRLTACSDIPLDRLCEICEAEKNGLLIKLPCKVGDTVYVLTTDSPSGIEETKIFQIRISKTSWSARCKCVYDDWGGAYRIFKQIDIGKTVFLTRESAEAALKGAE